MSTCPLCHARRELAPTSWPPVQLVGDGAAPGSHDPFQFTTYAQPLIEPTNTARPSSTPHLCADCRQRLYVWEGRVMRDIMPPLIAGDTLPPVLVYDSWLARLAASLAWRVLAAALHGGRGPAVPALQADTRAAMEAWRGLAVGGRDPGRFDLHMVPIGRLGDLGDERWYMRQVVHLRAVLTRTEDAWVWMKLPGVLFIGVIKAGLGALSAESRLHAAGPAIWSADAIPIPGVVRFLQFEELQRSLTAWRTVPQSALSERRG